MATEVFTNWNGLLMVVVGASLVTTFRMNVFDIRKCAGCRTRQPAPKNI